MPSTRMMSVRLSQASWRKFVSDSVTRMFVLILCSRTSSSYTRANSPPTVSICSSVRMVVWWFTAISRSISLRYSTCIPRAPSGVPEESPPGLPRSMTTAPTG